MKTFLTLMFCSAGSCNHTPSPLPPGNADDPVHALARQLETGAIGRLTTLVVHSDVAFTSRLNQAGNSSNFVIIPGVSRQFKGE